MTQKTSNGLAARFAAWCRQPNVWGYALAVVAIIIISFAFFYPAASEGGELRQYDMIQGRAIGQEAQAYKQATGEATRWTNSLFGGMPTFQISPTYPSNSLFDWITTVYGCGLPSPSNLLCMMMLGFLVLMMAMKVRPIYGLMGAIAYGLSTYFIIIIGAGHIWKFVTLAYIPPTIAGLMLAYRGRYLAGSALAALAAMMQIASNHAQMSYYFMFVMLGLVIAFLVKAVRDKSVKRWAIATGSLAVAGILAVAANLPSLYNTYEYSKETMRGAHTELTKTDATEGAPGASKGLDRDYITQYSYQPSETFSLLIPNIKGGASARPHQGQMQQMTLAQLPESERLITSGNIDQMTAQYLGFATQYFGDPEGTNGPVYVGAIIFALFLLGCWIVKGPVKWALLILTILSVLLAWGKHLMGMTDLFIDIVPMYSKFRTVESILVIAEFTIPLLAVLGLQKLLTSELTLKQLRWPLAFAFGLPILFCLIAIISPDTYGSAISETDRMISQQMIDYYTAQGYDSGQVAAVTIQNPQIAYTVQTLRYQMVEEDAMRSLLFVAGAMGVIALFLKGKLRGVSRMGVAAIICALVLIDLYSVNKRYLNHESFCPPSMSLSDPLDATPIDKAILADTTTHYRVMNIPEFNSPVPSYHHKAIGGYHAAKLTRYQDMIDRHLSHFQTGAVTDADYQVVNMLNGRVYVTGDRQVVQNPEALGNAWFVDTLTYVKGADAEMAAIDRLRPATQAVADEQFKAILGDAVPKAPGDTIRLTTYAPNRLTYHVNSAKGGVAVFSEVYFPWGWNAEIDGAPAEIGRVNYLLRAMRIPAGAHTVTMTFDPKSLHTTGYIATVAVILIYLLVIAALSRAALRRNPDSAESQSGADQSAD